MQVTETTPATLLAARLIERIAVPGLILAARGEARAARIAAAAAALAPELSVCLLPGWDCLPFDRISPSRAIMGLRMAALRRLAQGGPHLLVVSTDALAQRLPPPGNGSVLRLSAGDALDPDAFAADLDRLGYAMEEEVDAPGEAAIRGAVIDIFPADAARPSRLRLGNGRIEAIDRYDPATQRSTRTADALLIGAASELVFPEPRVRPPGIEHFLPDQVPDLVTPLDLLPQAALLLDPDSEALLADRFAQIGEARQTRLALRGDGDPRLPPAAFYLTPQEWEAALASRAVTRLQERAGAALPRFAADAEMLESCIAFVVAEAGAGRRVGVAGTRLLRALDEALDAAPVPVADWNALRAAAPGTIAALPHALEQGFATPEASVIAAADVVGPAAPGGARPWPAPPLRPGDAVVDLAHGMAVLRGLQTVDASGLAADTLVLEFADCARLLVPADEAGRIWRYGAEAEAVNLDRIDGKGWAARRDAIEAEIAETARGLVRLARVRREQVASRFVPPQDWMERFAAGFPFEPTADQAAAIAAILDDLAAGRPMDRLVCGDVGFGKTEVALRAAAAVALCGAQVVLLAPTTVLVRQHLETFRRRFASLRIKVAALSRLTPPAEARAVRTGLADGSIRVVLGTQALAGRGVRFARLGLVVIDEEHRFGARQKAMLHRLRAGMHALALTATPIPRTLQGALSGLQDLSVLATPPARRQPVRTVAVPFDPAATRSALARERRRGGQSFVVCPRIEDLEPVEGRLRTLLPDLDIIVAHGGMAADDLDSALLRFADGDGDVLLSTSIVESGLDIPRANTMLVWRADRFGLAQLHQLRGRVGRGRVRGLCWLFTDPEAPPTRAGGRRLRTLEAQDRPGAGFAIAARDLDQRGAGDLLGEAQAGHVRLVGLELYQHLLTRAVSVAEGRRPPPEWTPEVAVGAAAYLPEEYIPDAGLRIELHRRLARLEDPAALAEETEDRFGPPPPPVQALFAVAQLRVACHRLGVAKLEAGPAAAAATLRGEMREIPGLERRENRLLLRRASVTEAERLATAAALLRALAHATRRHRRAA